MFNYVYTVSLIDQSQFTVLLLATFAKLQRQPGYKRQDNEVYITSQIIFFHYFGTTCCNSPLGWMSNVCVYYTYKRPS